MKQPKLNKAQIEHIINYVTERGISRSHVQGDRFSDVDFAMGAAAVFFALELQEHIPAAWIFCPMSGEPIFTERKESHAETSLS